MNQALLRIGHAARDIVTGQTGIVTGLLVSLNTDIRVCLQSPMKSDGTRPDEQWMSIEQVEYVGEGVRDTIVEQTKHHARMRIEVYASTSASQN